MASIKKTFDRFMPPSARSFRKAAQSLESKIDALSDKVVSLEGALEEARFELSQRDETIARLEAGLIRVENQSVNMLDAVCGFKADVKSDMVAISNQLYENGSNLKRVFQYVDPEILSMLPGKRNGLSVLIVGFYGAPNLGDELMLETLLDEFRMHSDLDITVMLADNPQFDASKYGDVDILHYPKTRSSFSVIARRFDVLVVGGGALLDDANYGNIDFFDIPVGEVVVGLGVQFSVFGKRVYGLGLSTSTELENSSYIDKLTALVKSSSHFSLRDPDSLETLRRCGVPVEKVAITADLVFANKKTRCFYDRPHAKRGGAMS